MDLEGALYWYLDVDLSYHDNLSHVPPKHAVPISSLLLLCDIFLASLNTNLHFPSCSQL